MSSLSLEVLEERTKNLVMKVDDHTEEDHENFQQVFKLVRRIELSQARNGVIIAAVVVISNAIFCAALGAWLKGIF